MKNKIQTLCYQCKKCNKTEYFQSDMEYVANCKVCGNEMQLLWKNDYKPNSGLNAIRTSNSKNSMNTEFNLPNLTVECPYCHSSNTKKITNTSKAVHTAIFGIFSMSRNSQNFHCNNCNSDF